MWTSYNSSAHKTFMQDQTKKLDNGKSPEVLTGGISTLCAIELPAISCMTCCSQTTEQITSAKHSSPGHHALKFFHADAAESSARSLPDHVLQHILRHILAQLFCNTAQVVDADFPILVFGKQRISLLDLFVLRFRIVVSRV